MAARYALYYAPAPDSELWHFGSRWLGYDASSGEPMTPTGVGNVDPQTQARVTEAPRRYGLHATLKAPFSLAAEHTEQTLDDGLRAFARERRGFTLPPLRLARLDGFLALRPERDCPPLTALADACVEQFEAFRAPLTAQEYARRRPERLTPRERELLHSWGYPFVFEAFRFHISLTGALAAGELDTLQTVLAPDIAALRLDSMPVDALCLFVQPAPRAPFRLMARYRLGAFSRD